MVANPSTVYATPGRSGLDPRDRKLKDYRVACKFCNRNSIELHFPLRKAGLGSTTLFHRHCDL